MKTLFKIIPLILITAVIAGCEMRIIQPPAKDVDQTLLSETEQKKVELLRQIDKKYENPKAHYELGRLYHQDGLWDKAEWEYNRALAFDPIHRDAQAAIVKLLSDRGDEEKSKIMADIYMSQAAAQAQSSLLLGKAFAKETLDEYAVACYQQALQLAPNSAVINKHIGYYYLAKKDYVRAEEYLRRSFRINPYQAEVAGELGRMGVVVKIPRKTEAPSKKFDKILEQKVQE